MLAGRQVGDELFADLLLTFAVAVGGPGADASVWSADGLDTEQKPHLRKGQLARYSKEWYVALALAEPWLAGDDDLPFPPTRPRRLRPRRYRVCIPTSLIFAYTWHR